MSTRAVCVDRGDRSGRIFFAGGQIVHAEVGDLVGEHAFFEIIHWLKGSFHIEEGVRALDETITRNWESLLMEAAQHHDEGQLRTVTPFPLKAQKMNTNQIAEEFKDPDILQAVHYGEDGELLESKGADPEELQGTTAYVMQLLAHIGTSLGAEALREVHLVGTKNRALCVTADGATSAAVTTLKTNLTTLAKKLTTAMSTSLTSLKDIPGVFGSFVFSPEGQLIARDMPAVYPDSAFAEIFRRLESIAEVVDPSLEGFHELLAKFDGHWLLSRRSDKGTLNILAAESVNFPALKMAANITVKYLSQLEPMVPEIAPEPVEAPKAEVAGPAIPPEHRPKRFWRGQPVE